MSTPSPRQLALYAHRDFRPIIKAACKAGWTVSVRGSGHMRFVSPDGSSIVDTPVSSSMPAYIARLRRAGVPGTRR